jgi:hypothetical protein
MRVLRAALLVAVLPIIPVAAEEAEAPEVVSCGQGRAWWPPLETCVTVPILKKKVDPDFQDAPADLAYGALVYLHVSVKGTVSDVQIIKAPLEGEPSEVGEAALSAFVQAVRQWQFDPGFDPRGNPVAMTVVLKVNLRAQE